MLEGSSPVVQALLGTALTWALTLAGAAMALFLRGNQRRLLDTRSVTGWQVFLNRDQCEHD